MPNIKFSFLYRDAANYKTFGEVVFANPENLPLASIRQTIVDACNADQNFEPVRWGIPNIRTKPYDPDLDHDWFEFENVEETEEGSTISMDVTEWLGWVKSNPLW